MKLEDIFVKEESTIIEALAQLDLSARKILLVTRDGVLTAVVSDGDIRRWLLKKGDLGARVSDVANYHPKALNERERLNAKEYMQENGVEAIPIIDDAGKVLSVIFWDDDNIDNRKKIDLPVVIMAGGSGKRLYPYTKILPKPLIPIGDIPIVEHVINHFTAAGSNDFYLIINHKKNMIKAYFNEIDHDYSVTYIDETKPLGTGGGLSLLKGSIRKTFILSNCDILVEEDYEKMYRHHKQQKNLITMVCSLKNVKISYGVVEIDDNGEMERMKEKPNISFFTNTGFYLVEPRVIEELENDVYADFPDIITKYKEQGEKIGIYPIGEKAWMDMGEFDQMEEMKKRLNIYE